MSRSSEAVELTALSPRSNEFIPHSPFKPHENVPQAAFLLLPWREALYGGAAGGGKTDALLMAALQYVDVPGYAALLLRRTFPQLTQAGGLLPRAQEWLQGTRAHGSDTINGMPSKWTFPSGATLSFGHMQLERDRFNYQGGEYQFLGFDELTQFTRTQYLYLLSRLRRLEGSSVPVRVRSASNPGGEGHEWVLERFIPDWYTDGQTSGPPKRAQSGEPIVFIPAKLQDNPYLDRAAYLDSLKELDPVTRAQLMHGDWAVRPQGCLFQREKFTLVESVPQRGTPTRYWDLAATAPKPGIDPDWTRGVRGRVVDGELFIEDVRSTRSKPGDVEALIRQTAEMDGRSVPVWIEQEPGSSGVNVIDYYRRKILSGWSVHGHRVTGPQIERVRPLSALADGGSVYLLRGAWNAAFLDELESYPNVGIHDDQVTATAGLLHVLTAGPLSPAAFYGVESAA